MLTDVQIRKAKPAEKPLKLSDGGGLHLYISPRRRQALVHAI